MLTSFYLVKSTISHLCVTCSQIPGFYDHVAPNLIDLAWSSLQQHGGGEFSREGYQVRERVNEGGGGRGRRQPGGKEVLAYSRQAPRWCFCLSSAKCTSVPAVVVYQTIVVVSTDSLLPCAAPPQPSPRAPLQAALGVPALATPPSCRALLEARWARPSLSIVDMRPSASAAASSSSAERSACYR
jgi:hypothetical protein